MSRKQSNQAAILAACTTGNFRAMWDKQTAQLTQQERAVLQTLYEVAAGNGQDFGIVEEVPYEDRQALGGLLTSLQQKGILHVHGTMRVNGQSKLRRDRRAPGGWRVVEVGGTPVTQYTWRAPLETIRTYIGQ